MKTITETKLLELARKKATEAGYTIVENDALSKLIRSTAEMFPKDNIDAEDIISNMIHTGEKPKQAPASRDENEANDFFARLQAHIMDLKNPEK